MCRQYVVKLFLAFGVDPPADNTATREYEGVRAFPVDNGEFHIAIERSGIYWLPVHGGINHHKLTSVFDLNHLINAW